MITKKIDQSYKISCQPKVCIPTFICKFYTYSFMRIKEGILLLGAQPAPVTIWKLRKTVGTLIIFFIVNPPQAT